MQNINDVYIFVSDLVNSSQSGQVTPDNFNTYIDIAQQEFIRRFIGLPEDYKWKLTQAPIQFQVSQVVSDALAPISQYTPVNKSGLGFTLPSMILFGGCDYVYTTMDGNLLIAKQYPVTFKTWSEWQNATQSYLTPPSNQYPICTYFNGQLNILPNVINTINVYNVRYPKTPYRDYTVANDQDIYNPGGLTQQLEIPELYWKSIAAICIEYIATNLREQELLQTATKMQATGQ